MPKISREDFTWEFRRIKGREGKIDLPDEILKHRFDFLLTADELTDHKLSVAELNLIFILLSGILLGKYPQFASSVKNSDRIKVLYSLLEQLPFTKLKLTKDERLIFSFAVFHAVCTEFYDEKSNRTHKGILEIDSPEHVMNLLEWDKSTHPERYKFLLPSLIASSQSEPFALSMNNPVKAVSVSDGYRYLNRLRTKKGRPVKFHRTGSMNDSSGNIIDEFTLQLLDENMTIYINPHALKNSDEAPEGLMLASDEENQEYIEELMNRAKSGKGREDFNLAQKYYYGEEGFEKNYKEAFKCYMNSAEQGYVEAMSKLGLMYSRGYGVAHSFTEAAKWYAMAAEVDFPEALHNLGVLYCEGRGVTRDMDKAVEMWYRASEKGYELSQLSLGIIYLSEGNEEEAVKWLTKASENGNDEAKSMLSGIQPAKKNNDIRIRRQG
jgi:TPR repeat protein